jgi:hypothetical protein
MKKISFLVSVLSLVLSTFFISTPTYATVSDGSDPIQTGCANDAVTVRSDHFGPNSDAILELRYSPSCRSIWARVTIPHAADSSHSGYAEVDRSGSAVLKSCSVPVGQTSCYTPQLNDAGYTAYSVGRYTVGSTWYYGSTGSY